MDFTLEYIIGQIIVPLSCAVIGAGIGGFFVIRSTKVTLRHASDQLREEFEIERKAVRRSKMLALKIELDSNIKAMQDAPGGYVSVSTRAWEDSKDVLSHYGEEIVSFMTTAYIGIGSIDKVPIYCKTSIVTEVEYRCKQVLPSILGAKSKLDKINL